MSSNIAYTAGTTKSVSSVETVRPPMTAIAIGARSSMPPVAPSPMKLRLSAIAAGTAPAIDVGAVWREGRASCPSRHWLARAAAGTLEADPAAYVRFHLDEIHCEWCQANLDDLTRGDAAFAPVLEKVEASTVHYLRSRTRR